MDELLREAMRRADAAEVYVVRREEVPVAFEKNALKHIETKRTTGGALRLIRGGRIGFASSTDLADPAALVARALESAEIGEAARFDFPGPAAGSGVGSGGASGAAPRIYDGAAAALGADDLAAAGREFISAITSHDRAIMCDAALARTVEEVVVANSSGGGGTYRRTTLSAGIEAALVQENDILLVSREISSCRTDLDLRALGEEIARAIELARKVVPTRTGEMPVLFTPRGLIPLLISLEAALNGKTVFQGASPLGDKVGAKVFDSRVSVCDDGAKDWAVRSCPIDDEGVPTRRTPLIEAGVVKGFYYDLQTAGLARAQSTGNGFRTARAGDNFEGRPTPLSTSMVFAAGDASFDAMVASMDDGIIVDQVMGAGQGNILSGAFSTNVHLGYRVERGKIVGRVKNTMVAGNALEALNDIAAIGDRVQCVYGEYYAPAILFRSLGVATKA